MKKICCAMKRSLEDFVQLSAEGAEMNTKNAEKVDAAMTKVRETIQSFQNLENSEKERFPKELREVREEVGMETLRDIASLQS